MPLTRPKVQDRRRITTRFSRGDGDDEVRRRSVAPAGDDGNDDDDDDEDDDDDDDNDDDDDDDDDDGDTVMASEFRQSQARLTYARWSRSHDDRTSRIEP